VIYYSANIYIYILPIALFPLPRIFVLFETPKLVLRSACAFSVIVDRFVVLCGRTTLDVVALLHCTIVSLGRVSPVLPWVVIEYKDK
jgi:hypothetical protein